MTEKALAVFAGNRIRRHYDEKTETWFFSIVDVIQALIQQPDYQAARNYWKVLKNRLHKEGSESVTKCNRLKLEAADCKKYLTDVADPETILRLIQSVPSPKAEPIKLWLAMVGYERMQDMADPARSLNRAREFWRQHGRSEKWIQQRNNWSNANSIRKIFRDAFVNAGLPYFKPHSFRTTLVQLGQEVCKTPEQFKAWSQNLGHEKVLTTFLSCGGVGCQRQGQIIRGLAEPQQGMKADADDIAEAVIKKLRGAGVGMQSQGAGR